MRGFNLTIKALADLKGIARYTETMWGRDQRIKYLMQLDCTFAKLAKNPNLGVGYEEVRGGYRGYREGSHIIFFRKNNAGVEIIRILHQAMDVETRLEEK